MAYRVFVGASVARIDFSKAATADRLRTFVFVIHFTDIPTWNTKPEKQNE